MSKLAPSILTADFSNLGKQAVAVSKAGADYLHIDVMDGHFVPNISFGPYVMKSMDNLETAPYDVHLMIENPDEFLKDFVTKKTEYITVHQEIANHLHRTIQNIHSLGIKAGVAINPATSIITLENILEDVDLILVMSVNPGFGGQKFIPVAIDKIEELASIRDELGLNYLIEVDGGINLKNAESVKEAGCDIVVVGSAIFNEDSISNTTRKFKRILK